MSQKILFIGNYTDEATYQIITQQGIRDLSQAARLFQQRLINSLAEQSDDFRVISVLPTDSRIHLPETITEKKTDIKVVPVANGSVGSMLQAMKRIRELVKKSGRDTRVLMYAVNPIALLPLLQMKKRYDLELITICPELPIFRRYRKTITNRAKRFLLKTLNEKFDKYILFSEPMKDYLPPNRKYMVIEGFAPDNLYEPIKKEKNIAMYAGGLAADNGIELMLKVAERSESIDELWICGVGDCRELVENNTSCKIKYFGRLENFQVIELERKAKVLLNLRNPEDPLTSFSFPSKVLEYMSSGTLVLSTKLNGISKEYYNYIVTVDDYTLEAITDSLEMIFNMNDDKYLEMTKKASEFIKKKTSIYRIKELLKFVGDN